MRAGIAQSSVVEIWAENAEAFRIFSAMMTQWRTGYGGPTGLDYAALPVVLEMGGPFETPRAELFDAVRVMEVVALKVFADNRKRK